MPTDFQHTLSSTLLTAVETQAPYANEIATLGAAETELSAIAAIGSTGMVQYAEVAVSSAEILALNATPKTLVAAPGAGFTLEFVSAVMILDYNSAAYDTQNGILGVYETDEAGNLLSGTSTLASFLGLTADAIVVLRPEADATPSVVPQAMSEDVPLVLGMATGETLNGDSPIRVKIAYRVHATGL